MSRFSFRRPARSEAVVGNIASQAGKLGIEICDVSGHFDEVAARVSTDGELDRARAILARKYRDVATTREEKARRMRFLQSRGFSFDTIRGALAVDEEDIRS